MDNVAIARALDDLADLEELSGAAVHKVRALRGAARAVVGLSESVVDLARAGKVKDIRGVGEGVARRIGELLETGKIAELEELRQAFPPSLIELTNVPGVGLRTAQQVYRELEITTIDQLEFAARAGRLRGLPRFGKKREDKLVVAIEEWRKRAAAPKRRPIADAMAAADRLVERLRAVPGVLACEVAGSVRRRAETVADLDIVVAASAADAPRVMQAFAGAPQVVQVLGQGVARTSVVLDGGMQADLRVVPQGAYGAALQYFTGSKDHNVAMRTLALKRKLEVSEYGVFDARGAKIAGDTEASVYAAVGLPWIPPELRENRGELEAAIAGRLPKLVELDDIRGDLHMHTTETDGKSTLEQMAEAARALGRSYVAITDHSETLTFVRGLGKERLRAQRKRIREVEESLGGSIRLLAGLEADILGDGTLDVEDELPHLDWVVGSVHTLFGMSRDEMTKRVIRAIESGKMDCLAHPTGRQLGWREPYAIDLEAVIAAMKRAGVAIEINSSPSRLDADERTARMARDAGVLVVIDSDAHGVRELSNLRYGIGVARRAWLSAEHVLNTRSARELEHWRAARRS